LPWQLNLAYCLVSQMEAVQSPSYFAPPPPSLMKQGSRTSVTPPNLLTEVSLAASAETVLIVPLSFLHFFCNPHLFKKPRSRSGRFLFPYYVPLSLPLRRPVEHVIAVWSSRCLPLFENGRLGISLRVEENPEISFLFHMLPRPPWLK